MFEKRLASSSQHDGSYYHIGSHSVHKAWVVLAGCCFLQAGSMGFILGTLSVYYVPVCTEMGFARSQLALYITAYFLSSVFALPIAGRILEKYDARIVTSVCAVACALAVAAMSFYTQIWQWIVSGIVFGTFGCCVFQVPAASMIGNWFEKRAGIAMGISAAGASVAAAIGAPIFTLVIQAVGWRTAYLIQGLVVLAMILPWSISIFRLHPEEVGALPYGCDDPEQLAQRAQGEVDLDTVAPSFHRGASLKASILSVSFLALFIFAGIGVFIGSGFDVHLPGFAQSLGFDALMGAGLVSALQIGSLTEKLLMGFVNDKLGVHFTIYVELLLVVIGVIGLINAQEYWQLLLFGFLFGIQDSFTSISIPLMTKELFGVKNYAQVYSWVRIGSGVMGAFSASLVGHVFDMTGSYIGAFQIAIGLCILGAVLVSVAYAFKKRIVWDDANQSKGIDVQRGVAE